MEPLRRISEFLYASRRRLATGGVALVALALAWHVLFGANGMMMYEHKRAEYRKLQSEIDSMQQENQQLEQQVEKLRSDPATIERAAREQLHYARPGEEIYTIPAPPRPKPPTDLNAQKR
jgi:cell division protein FtsB